MHEQCGTECNATGSPNSKFECHSEHNLQVRLALDSARLVISCALAAPGQARAVKSSTLVAQSQARASISSVLAAPEANVKLLEKTSLNRPPNYWIISLETLLKLHRSDPDLL